MKGNELLSGKLCSKSFYRGHHAVRKYAGHQGRFKTGIKTHSRGHRVKKTTSKTRKTIMFIMSIFLIGAFPYGYPWGVEDLQLSTA